MPQKPAPTSPPSGRVRSRDLPLPHDRDEAKGQVDHQPDKVIEQAKRDLDAGMVDTDMRATPGLDAQRRDKLVKGKP